MKKNSLKLEEQLLGDLREEYTIEEFTKILGWKKPESLRQACRGQIDSHNRKAKLPEEVYAVPPRKNWIIKFKKQPFIHRKGEVGRNFKELKNPLLAKSLDTFLDYDTNISPCMNLTIINLENTPQLLIYNGFDFIPNSSVESELGDMILYYYVQKLLISGKKDFIKNTFSILTGWLDLANIYFSYHIRSAVKKEPPRCLYCGFKLRDKLPTLSASANIDCHFRMYYFCSKVHKDNFDNRSNSLSYFEALKQLKEKIEPLTKIKDLDLGLIDDTCNKIIDGLIIENRKLKRPGIIQIWSREFNLYEDLMRRYGKNDDELETLAEDLKIDPLDLIQAKSLNIVPLYEIINKCFKGSKGKPKYTLAFLEDHDTHRVIANTLFKIIEDSNSLK